MLQTAPAHLTGSEHATEPERCHSLQDRLNGAGLLRQRTRIRANALLER